jgi:hypothetical protein
MRRLVGRRRNRHVADKAVGSAVQMRKQEW